jgi:hypothetical protein
MSSKTKPRSGSSSRIAVGKRSRTTPTAVGDPVDATSRMAELLNEMEALIPDLVQPDISRIKRISQSAKFGQALIPHVITAVSSYAPFQQRNLFDVTAGQAALDYQKQLHPITIRMAAMTLAMSYSVNQKLAVSGEEALQMYQWAKRHVKQPDGGGARTYVDEMQSVVGRTMNRRRKPQTPPTTPPAGTAHVQGFLAPGLGATHTPDDDEVLDLVRDVAGADAKE